MKSIKLSCLVLLFAVTTLTTFGQVVAKADNGSYSATCANSAAGINSCDSSLGAHVGEVTVMGDVTATDAQITVGAGHRLHVKGTLTIEAASPKGPILLSQYSRLQCDSNGGVGSGNIIEGTAGATLTSMIRVTQQNGSVEAAYIENCSFNANGANFTRGAIDITGFEDKSRVIGNTVYGYATGWALYADDDSSGVDLTDALAFSLVEGNWFNSATSSTTGTVGCISVTHSSSTTLFMTDIVFHNNECQMNPNYTGTTIPVVFQNNKVGAYVRGIFVDGLAVQTQRAAGTNIYIYAIQASTFKNVHCFQGGTCIQIDSASPGVSFENVTMWNGGTNIYDTTGPSSISITTPVVEHYLASNYSAPSQSVFGISRLHAFGAPPSISSSTGFGTSPTLTIETNSTDNFGTIVVTAGSGASSSGTLVLGWSASWDNAPACTYSLHNGSGTWNARSTAIGGGLATGSGTLKWDNNGVALSNGSSYRFAWSCGGR